MGGERTERTAQRPTHRGWPPAGCRGSRRCGRSTRRGLHFNPEPEVIRAARVGLQSMFAAAPRSLTDQHAISLMQPYLIHQHDCHLFGADLRCSSSRPAQPRRRRSPRRRAPPRRRPPAGRRQLRPLPLPLLLLLLRLLLLPLPTTPARPLRSRPSAPPAGPGGRRPAATDRTRRPARIKRHRPEVIRANVLEDSPHLPRGPWRPTGPEKSGTAMFTKEMACRQSGHRKVAIMVAISLWCRDIRPCSPRRPGRC